MPRRLLFAVLCAWTIGILTPEVSSAMFCRESLLVKPPPSPPAGTRIERVSILNLAKALRTGRAIFPGDRDAVRDSYLASLLPSWLLSPVTRIGTSIALDRLEYYALRDAKSGALLGVTGLYSVKNSTDIWIGWYGMSEAARGRGLGKALLTWSINRATQLDYKTVRLWTTSEPVYQTANVIYQQFGFLKQDTGLVDSAHDRSSLLLYSLGVNGNVTTPFLGDIREALLGATDKDIAGFERVSMSL